MINAINYEILATAMEDKKMTIEQLSTRTSIAEGTVKNIVTGKTTHSSAQNVYAICNELDVPIEQVLGYSAKTALEVSGAKEHDVSILVLKELYEAQLSERKEVNEAHIANIRSHYEQHHADLKENYEMRLSDKREINENLKEQINDLKKSNKRLGWIVALFVIGVTALLILEFMHPEHGWIRWGEWFSHTRRYG